VLTKAVVNREYQYAKNQANSHGYGQGFAFSSRRSKRVFWGRVRYGIDLSFIDKLERRLIEIATFVRFRIEEETLGATFHYGLTDRISRFTGQALTP
jgi:hypothetical protein